MYIYNLFNNWGLKMKKIENSRKKTYQIKIKDPKISGYLEYSKYHKGWVITVGYSFGSLRSIAYSDKSLAIKAARVMGFSVSCVKQ